MNYFAGHNAGFSNHDSVELPLKHLLGATAFAQLENEEQERLESVRWLVRAVEKGSSLIDQGADRKLVSLILSGWAFRYQTLSDGKRQILDFAFASSLVGFGSGAINMYGVETVTDCMVATLSFGQFRRLLTTCPTLALQVVERVSHNEMRAHEHMTSLGRRNARERIAALILELVGSTGRKDSGLRNYSFDLPITQCMIGDALGLSNEHVCRTLGKLAKDGVIEINTHTLKVLDRAALTREAGVDLDQCVFQAEPISVPSYFNARAAVFSELSAAS